MKNDKDRCYSAHYNPITQKYQSVYLHDTETAAISVIKNTPTILKNIIWLAGIYHDSGKLSILWQDYFNDKIMNPGDYTGSKEDHSTAGGILLEELIPASLLLELLQMTIYSHHGLQDSISLEDSTCLYTKRKEKSKKLPLQECRAQFYKEFNADDIIWRCEAAKKDSVALKNKIQDTIKNWGQASLYGNKDFYLGMYVRLLISLLIDADRRNTEDFMSDLKPNLIKDDLAMIWEQCQENLEKKIARFTDKSGINEYRSEISDTCRKMAENPHHLYQLTVSTGAGKTLSSLRFAVAHARKFHKKRIIYVAPFHSIVEQNSDEIKNALGRPEIVLEHHCNIILENEEEQITYDRLTEDWSSPVIVTTAVQFLNTCFSGKTACVRRMQSLCESVIIIDEVQALPIKVLELFNMAMNFLTEFLDSTVVLCTATQPLLDAVPQNRLRPPKQMIEAQEVYREKLRRTEITDCTAQIPGGMNIQDAAEFILEKAKRYKKVLFIANTKACAQNLFLKVKELCEVADITHLSTRMCPEHRSIVLSAVKETLNDKKKKDTMQICISTNLIEAGVDISFRCVIRSLAGLDSIIQSAGRCNRNREEEIGHVFLVRMNEKEEHISKLKDVRMAQNAMLSVLDQFRSHPEKLDGQLDSSKAVKMYYEYYFHSQLNESGNQMSFPVTVKDVPTTIVSLLSGNQEFAGGQKWMLKQAFKTAGEEFEVISEDGKISVIVIYEESVNQKLSELENPYLPLSKKKQILRELQRYTISMSQTEKNKVEQGIYGVWDNRIMVLESRFYDPQVGLITEPGPMPDLQY